jgi:single-strand DNA-binding protein
VARASCPVPISSHLPTFHFETFDPTHPMNSVNLIGRTTAAPSLTYIGETNRPMARFNLAVDNPAAKKDPTQKSYFFQCVIWGAKAETAAHHIVKGQQIAITGRLAQEEFIPQGQTQSVQKTRIVVDQFTFLARPFNQNESTTQET